MTDLKSRVAYLQGLAAGMDLPQDSKEGRLLHGIVEVLDDVAGNVHGLEEAQDNLEDYLESIDEDLYVLENEFYEEDDADAGDYTKVECPECQSVVCVDNDLLEDGKVTGIQCPNCDAEIDLASADKVHPSDHV